MSQYTTISNKHTGVLDINIPDNINEINITGYHEGMTVKLIPNKESNASEGYSIDNFVDKLKDTRDYHQNIYYTYDMTIDVYAMNRKNHSVMGSVNLKKSVTDDSLLYAQFKIYLPTNDNSHFYLDIVGEDVKEIDLTDKPSLDEKVKFFKRELFDYAFKEVAKARADNDKI